jgi:DNA-directed RNA polymerase subunit alpha
MTKREDNPNVAEFRLQPLERGFGYTLGNSLRRLLLSSLRGSAVWAFRLDGVVHEHQTVQGVLEDVHQIIQRLKALTLVLDEVDERLCCTSGRDGAGPVYATSSPTARWGHQSRPAPLHAGTTATGTPSCTNGRGYVESRCTGRLLHAGRRRFNRRHQPGPPPTHGGETCVGRAPTMTA